MDVAKTDMGAQHMPYGQEWRAQVLTAPTPSGNPQVDWYLRAEYRGGSTVEELVHGEGGTVAKAREAFTRFVKAVLYDRRRAKPVPAV